MQADACVYILACVNRESARCLFVAKGTAAVKSQPVFPFFLSGDVDYVVSPHSGSQDEEIIGSDSLLAS